MTPLDPFFLFPLGAEVTLRAMLTPFVWMPAQPPEAQVPEKLVVLARQVLEGPGGAQQHYHCRVLAPEGLGKSVGFSRELFWFNAIELAPYPVIGGTP